ncbi:MAG: chalcone isomerase family protein [Bdellovibrionales bacterium]|nr:chalcone isomerase family protein [Bdellovibrionales bacterium]
MTIALLALCLLAGSNAADATRFPERVQVADQPLRLNGSGTRTATLFAIKIYDAAFYADRSIATLADALAAPNPKRLEIRYLRDFDLKDTQEAWRYQFKESAELKDGALASEIDRLVALQRPIARGDTHRFDLLDGKTVFSINGEKRGEIEGTAFQTALLTIFFGPHPPTQDLQKGLTRGVREEKEGE